MNYNMQGMTKTIPELFTMLKLEKVEIKKEYQALMVNKNTSFKKRGKHYKKGHIRDILGRTKFFLSCLWHFYDENCDKTR